MTEEVLQDGPDGRRVVRVGDTVRRPPYPWTAAVHELLAHLNAVGFTAAPRPLGWDGQGREILEYREGSSGPDGWAPVVTSEGLAAFARLLRDLHDATAEFTPEPGGPWVAHFGTLPRGRVVCHGDYGPWNAVWEGNVPVGLLDWDHTHPGDRMDDVAYALEYAAPFRDDRTCVRWLRYPEPPDRAVRLARFCSAYGLTSTDGIVDAVIRRQRATVDLVRRLADEGVQPQAEWVRQGRLAELDARTDWSLAHRGLFEGGA